MYEAVFQCRAKRVACARPQAVALAWQDVSVRATAFAPVVCLVAVSKHSVYTAQNTSHEQQGNRQLHIPTRMFPYCCTCGVLSRPVATHSFYAVVLGPTVTNSVAGVCA